MKSRPFPILILGPKHVGKTRVGRLLAEYLRLPFYDLASLDQIYWDEAGFDPQVQGRMRDADRWGGIFHYQMPFHALALERAVSDYSNAVLEGAAAQAVYTNPDMLADVQQFLQPYQHIFLLLYSSDTNVSLRVLRERQPQEYIMGRPFWDYAVKHPTHFVLAKHIVYTDGRTLDEIGHELLQRIDPTSCVILIGPIGAGKTTMADWLASHLQLPHISLDEVCSRYHREYETLHTYERLHQDAVDPDAHWHHEQQLALYAITRVLQEHPRDIIAFGGFHSTFDTPSDIAQAQAILAAYPNVILLLPSPNLDESSIIVQERTKPLIDGIPLDRVFYDHLSCNLLSATVLYAEGKTPEVVVDELLQRSPFLVSCT